MRPAIETDRRTALKAIAGAAACGLVGGAADAWAQGYPDRPVRFLVSFAPGGPTDIMARLIGGKLSENLHKQFYVENQGAAGGNLAIGQAARSAPDGSTILVSSSSFVINPSLYLNAPYDPIKDFSPITIAGDSPHVFLVHPSLPAKTMKEFIALVQANPGKYSYAASSIGSGPHFSAEMLKLTFKLDLATIPYRGGGPAVQAVVANHTPVACTALPPAVEMIKSGQVRALAVTSPERFPSVLEVPTLKESGITGQEATTIQVFLAPAGTPKAIVDFLYSEIAKIVNGPGMKERFIELGYKPIANTPAQVAEQIKFEVPRWRQLIEDAHIEKM
jgi:tripartite-type tricarboxylate transporter receptor subunit TctC